MKQFPTGLGFWIAFHPMAHTRAAKSGYSRSWDGVADHMCLLGAKWVAVRVPGELVSNTPNSVKAILDAFGARGIGVYAWYYSYPGQRINEVAKIVQYQHNGLAGCFVDAEIEWTNHHQDAVVFGHDVRQHCPDFYVAHAPLGWKQYHPNWPYAEFGEWCDSVHPQMYWTELKNGSYKDMVDNAIPEWEKLVSVGDAAAKVFCPIGVTYGNGDVFTQIQPPGKITTKDVNAWLEYTQPHNTDSPFSASSLYSYEVMPHDIDMTIRAYYEATRVGLAGAEVGPTEDGSNG